jgi:hypothetical protein
VLGVFIVIVVSMLAICVFGLVMVQSGLRIGDQRGDAAISASLAGAGQPDEPRPVILVTVHNPADVPLLAGFCARRRLTPGWLDPGMTVQVPRRTDRRRLRAAAHDVVGVVPGGEDAEFAVPVTGRRSRAGRYLLTAALGQSGGRLRVLRLPVSGGYDPGSGGALARPSRPYLDDGQLT